MEMSTKKEEWFEEKIKKNELKDRLKATQEKGG